MRRRAVPLLALATIVASGCSSLATVSPGFRQLAQIPVGADPGNVAVAPDGVWVPNTEDGTISKIDPGSDRAVVNLKVGDRQVLLDGGCGPSSVHAVPIGSYDIRRCDLPNAVAVAGSTLWVTRNDTQELERRDARTGTLLGSVHTGLEAFGLAATETDVWITDFQNSVAVRVDVSTMEVVARFTDLQPGPTGVLILPTSVWIANSRVRELTRIDPSTNQVSATVEVEYRPLPLVSAFGSVWARCLRSDVVLRLDPITGQVLARVEVAPPEGKDGVDQLAADGTGVWVSGLHIKHIDARTNQVDRTLARDAMSLAAGFGSLWLTDVGGTVSRLDVGG